jgi:predicted HTH domain antitoxin
MREQQTLTQLNLRIPMTLAHQLEELAEAEHIAKIDIARQLLWEGVTRRRQELALRLYGEGEVRKSRAVELAGLSLWELTEIVAQKGLRWDYDVEEAKQEMATVVAPTKRRSPK